MKVIKLKAKPVLALVSLLVAVAAAWLAIGTQPWAQTLLIFAVGGLYLFFPPSGGIPKSLLVVVCLLLLLAGTAFLPATWMGTAFRQPFQAHGIELPPTLSLQPWWSLEDLTLLLTTLLWAKLCLDSNFSVNQREFLIASYLLALGLIAVTGILHGTTIGQHIPLFVQSAGRFANPNQTGDLLVMGGVFTFARGLSEISKKKVVGLPWILLTMVFMVDIIQNTSRAAVILFVLGLLLVSISMPKTRRHGPVFGAVLFLVVFFGLLVFVSMGSGLIEKFHDWFGGNDYRLSIYQDVTAMLLRIPWCGVGLGNFEGVFNVMRAHTQSGVTRSLHPESDWFWAASELGLPGVILFVLLLITVYRRYFLKSPCPDLTKPSLIVAVLFLIHSLFDVGGHRLGTAWSCIYLVGLGAFGAPSPTDKKIPLLFFRAAGLLLLALTLFRIQSISVQPWMPTRASVTKVEESLNQNFPLAEQLSLLNRSITWAPLDWVLYYRRALLCMQIPEQASQSTADFDRVLFLEQNTIQIPIAIGEACLHTNMPEALAAWKELLKRASGRQREGLYGSLFHLNLDDKARMEVASLAGEDPALQTIAVISCTDPQQFTWFLQNLLKANPTLKGVSSEVLQELFDHWVKVGDPAEFIKDWPLHPNWRDPGWKTYVRALSNAGRYREAVTTTLAIMPAASIPAPPAHQSVDDAMRQYLANPQDPYSGMMLYHAQMALGSKEEALKTLLEVAKLPNRPAYVPILLARQLLDGNQDVAAWQALEQVLQ